MDEDSAIDSQGNEGSPCSSSTLPSESMPILKSIKPSSGSSGGKEKQRNNDAFNVNIKCINKENENQNDRDKAAIEIPVMEKREQQQLLNENVNSAKSPSKYDDINLEMFKSHHDFVNKSSSTIYFNDGKRLIDFVLVYASHDIRQENSIKENIAIEFRKIFEANLLEDNLHLEYADDSSDSALKFIKIHAPWDVLSRYAEILKLKMPMKQIETNWKIIFDDDDPYTKKQFTYPFSRDKEYLFDIPPIKENFFTSAQRSQIVEFILKRKSFSDKSNDASAFGLNKLLQENVYNAAYPLHEGKITSSYSSSKQRTLDEQFGTPPRVRLLNTWASVSSMFTKQPLDEIRRYFGVKIALYFAWLGFYTSMLIPASLVGILCFLYGVFTLPNDVPSKQICEKMFDHTPMCPLCTMKDCGFWNMSTSCTYAQVTYLFDNPGTVFFAIFMSLWATVYLEMWKRYSARITFRWDLSSFDSYEEYPRPEYLAKLSRSEKKKLNVITRMYEPYVPFWRKQLPYSILSGAVVLLLILVAFIAVFSVIIYRVTVRAALAASYDYSVVKYSSLITSATAAILNLICIMILNMIYSRLAHFLTEMEMPRTQTDYDNSLTLKLYLLQFVNYYSSIFYIAFFKGRFITYPGDLSDNQSSLSIRTQEECGIGGCLVELAIQLAIIMVGKQALNAIFEMSSPHIEWIINKWRLRKKKKNDDDTSDRPGTTQSSDDETAIPQWKSDYLLAHWRPQALFYEYLEMVLQFGFVTIFVAAFPLAPVFALINNTLEIRLDAKKMVTSMRRPVAQRVKNIGVWYRILDSIGKLSVITSALVIAFTSDFIPKLYHYAKNRSLKNYINSTLSYYVSSEFDRFNIVPSQSEFCMYQGHRWPPNSGENTYKPTQQYWEEIAVKLAFIVIFENVIACTTMIVKWIIPDVPRSLRQQIRQHEYLSNDLIMQRETKRAKGLDSCSHLDEEGE